MGEQQSRGARDDAEMRAFTRAILRDLEALEQLLEQGRFETGAARFGVEQEMYLVECAPPHRPAPIAPEILAAIDERDFTHELASFNLEVNLDPAPLQGGFLHQTERTLSDHLARVNAVARERGAAVVLAGILPTLCHRDLTRDRMTPGPRFDALDSSLRRLRATDSFGVFIRGQDVLDESFESVMVESANCSVQLHLQVEPESFARRYNLAQAVSAPLVAVAANSPVLLGHRLWHETRVALFEACADSRSPAEVLRGGEPRVGFGSGWVRSSPLELFRDTALRYRVLLIADGVEDARAALAAGRVPRLQAITLHNGTVWRWNRPCYGVADGVPHLRIESRVLPAGPTVRDEVANAALFYGLMTELGEAGLDVSEHMDFDDAKANLTVAARYGLDASLTWLDDRTVLAADLLTTELLPAARRGLARIGCDAAEIDLYVGVLEGRVRSRQTGARWVLDSLADSPAPTRESALEAVGASMLAEQRNGRPVHLWPLAKTDPDATPVSWRRGPVRHVMSSQLHTVRPEDAVDLAASMMEWRGIDHVPVEDGEGRAAGVVTSEAIAELQRRGGDRGDDADPPPVASVMQPAPAVDAETSVEAAAHVLLEGGHGCLLVTSGERLIGIVTAADLMRGPWQVEPRTRVRRRWPGGRGSTGPTDTGE